jgi:tRNA modification GTPase
MSETRVAVLTPPGSSAVAVLAVRGSTAWPVLQRLFRTARDKSLHAPPVGFMFGRLGEKAADEVILATVGPDSFEIHCHGGPRVVSWLLELLRMNGVDESPLPDGGTISQVAERLLPFARTTRTAAILLGQAAGAFERAEQTISAGGPQADDLRAMLGRNVRVGRHLVLPWTVAIAGLPNAGKSSLLNALAGFARSVVSPTPGTTRDAVFVSLAFDGWPVDLIDTAGLREAADAVEFEGVERARAAAMTSDLVLWVVDSTECWPGSVVEIATTLGVVGERVLVVFNKIDLVELRAVEFSEAARVSALTGVGIAKLAARIASTLVPHAPAPGEPVPFTRELCDRWS